MLETVENPNESNENEPLLLELSAEQMELIIQTQEKRLHEAEENSLPKNSVLISMKRMPPKLWEETKTMTPGKVMGLLRKYMDVETYSQNKAGRKAAEFISGKTNMTEEEAQVRIEGLGLRNTDIMGKTGIKYIIAGAFIVSAGPGSIVVLATGYAISHLVGSLFDTTVLVKGLMRKKGHEEEAFNRRNEVLENLFSSIYFDERENGKDPTRIKREIEALMLLYEFHTLSRKNLDGLLSDREKSRRSELKNQIKNIVQDREFRDRMKKVSVFSTLLFSMGTASEDTKNSQKYEEFKNKFIARIGADSIESVFNGLKKEDIEKEINNLAELEKALQSARRKIWPLKHIIFTGLIPVVDYRTSKDILKKLKTQLGSKIRASTQYTKSVVNAIKRGPDSKSDIVKWVPVKIRKFSPENSANLIKKIAKSPSGLVNKLRHHTSEEEFLNFMSIRFNELKKLHYEKRNNLSKNSVNSAIQVNIANSLIKFINKKFGKDIILLAKEKASSGLLGIDNNELKKILKEKNAKSNLRHLTGVDDIKIVLEELIDCIERQKSNPNLITEEFSLISVLEAKFSNLNNYERILVNYFREARGLKYSKKWMGIGHRIIKGASKTLLFAGKPFLNLNVKGKENLPARGPAIVASRHYHATFDQGVLVYTEKVKMHFIAASLIFPKYKSVMSGRKLYQGGVIPVKIDKGRPLKDENLQEETEEFEKTFSTTGNMKEVTRLLHHGEIVAIFPEGVAQTGGNSLPKYSPYTPPKRGYVFMAYMIYKNYSEKVPIITVGLKYDEEHGTKPRWCKTRIGKPFYIPFERFANKDRQTINQMIDYYTNAIFDRIKFLSENWEGEPPEIPYPEDHEKEIKQASKDAEKMVMHGEQEHEKHLMEAQREIEASVERQMREHEKQKKKAAREIEEEIRRDIVKSR